MDPIKKHGRVFQEVYISFNHAWDMWWWMFGNVRSFTLCSTKKWLLLVKIVQTDCFDL